MDKLLSDPEQRLMLAVWMMALHDINQGYLLKNKVFNFSELDQKGAEIVENYWDAMTWFRNGDGIFHLVAAIFNVDPLIFQQKSLSLIEQSKNKIDKRSKLTNEYIYATVSRFRNYDKELS